MSNSWQWMVTELRASGIEIRVEIYPEPSEKYPDGSGVPYYVQLINRHGPFWSTECRADGFSEALYACYRNWRAR